MSSGLVAALVEARGAVLALLCAPAVAFGQPAAPATRSSSTQLTFGVTLNASQRAGDTFTYAFAADEGRTYLIEVKQDSLDLIVTVQGPSGASEAFNAPARREGDELILLERTDPGTYIVELRSEEHTGAVGGHTIRVSAIAELADARELDPWLRTHLIAQRCEELYAEVKANLGVSDDTFPPAPGHNPDDAPKFFGYGPYLGLPQKYSVLILTRVASLARYTRAYQKHETEHPRRYRAMLVEAANPAHSLADTRRMREALDALDTLVVIDVAMSETARLADYVLPAATQFEKAEATFFNFDFPDNVFHLNQNIAP